MDQIRDSFGRRIVSGVALAGGAAVLATGMALAGASTASADVQTNVVRDGNKVAPQSTASLAATADNNPISAIGTVLQNAQIQLGTAGQNAITQTGTAVSNGQVQVGTAGTNAISQTGTAISNGQTQVGTAGTNAISQLGQAGNGVLGAIGGLFNRG